VSADVRPRRPAARGRLRIYLGYAPGAGATCALLGEGRRRAELGAAVVVASAETHGRPHRIADDRRADDLSSPARAVGGVPGRVAAGAAGRAPGAGRRDRSPGRPDRRAWHRAQATLGPDEDVAAELERSAGRAQARGGLAAAAAFLERSAALTLEPVRRAERALAAAQVTYQAGEFDATLALLATAEAGPPDQLRRARADRLRGQIAFSSSRGSDAPPLLLKAARQFEPLDPRLARETYLDALAAATFAGRLALGGGMREVAEAARTAPPPPGPARGPDLLLDGISLVICEGYPAGAPVLRQAVSAFRGADLSTEEGLRWLWLACRAALIVWDSASFDVLSDRQVTLARDAGAQIVLPIAFNMRSTAASRRTAP
jgi:hypothetical protein